MAREPVWYWVRRKFGDSWGRWVPGEWAKSTRTNESYCWWLSTHPFGDGDYEVGPRIYPPDAPSPVGGADHQPGAEMQSREDMAPLGVARLPQASPPSSDDSGRTGGATPPTEAAPAPTAGNRCEGGIDLDSLSGAPCPKCGATEDDLCGELTGTPKTIAEIVPAPTAGDAVERAIHAACEVHFAHLPSPNCEWPRCQRDKCVELATIVRTACAALIEKIREPSVKRAVTIVLVGSECDTTERARATADAVINEIAAHLSGDQP